MKKFFLILLLAFIFPQLSAAQAVIQGTVEEAGTGNPIPGVNVYLAGTTIGSSTDKGGYYKFTPSTTGFYDLVFSFVGYKKQVRRVELTSASSITLDIEMKEEVEKLDEIEIKSSNKKWKKQYKIFFDQFIGENKYAKEVTVENPWVLNFEEERGYLIATSSRPIHITNKALGYKLYVELVKFKWPKFRDRGGAYKIYPKYEPLGTESEEQRHRWTENRVKNYVGSFSHFLKTLYHDDLEASDFSIGQSWNLKPLSKGKTRFELMSKPGLPHNLIENARGFELVDKVDVEFDGLAKYRLNGERRSISIEKRGGIIPNNRDHFFFVDQYGSLVNPFSLQVYRAWADNRIANSLPTNYSIGN